MNVCASDLKHLGSGGCLLLPQLPGSQTPLHNALKKSQSCLKIEKMEISQVGGTDQLTARTSTKRRLDKEWVVQAGRSGGAPHSHEKDRITDHASTCVNPT